VIDQQGQAKEVPWSNVRVGDVVRVHKDTEFPADLLLLHASGGKDIVYVDTMNLDGETNLKDK
jgi:P-type E1-E2 ATPase